MTPEFKAAQSLFQTFERDDYCDEVGEFNLNECKYHIREAVAEVYLSSVDETTQVEIIIDAYHKLQDESGQTAITSMLFGSPLHGVKKLRELITNEVILLASEEVERLVYEQLRQEALEYAI